MPTSAVWNHERLGRLRFVWQHCPTYSDYSVEASYDSSVFNKTGAVTVKGDCPQLPCLTDSGAMNVMRSLTERGRKAFWILALNQRTHGVEQDYHGREELRLVRLTLQDIDTQTTFQHANNSLPQTLTHSCGHSSLSLPTTNFLTFERWL
jgi:hypothetical protein